MSEEKAKIEGMLCDMCDIVKHAVTTAKTAIAAQGASLDTEEIGEVVDMIKDYVETEEKAAKACYYKKVTEAMEDYGDDFNSLMMRENEHMNMPHNDREGYDSNRYANGRFAPKGHGNMTHSGGRGGFTPTPNMHHMEQEWAQKERDLEHGRAYHNYNNAKRFYTETKDMNYKHEMSEHAKEHVMNMAETCREIYMNADPELRREMKTELSKLVGEMM